MPLNSPLRAALAAAGIWCAGCGSAASPNSAPTSGVEPRHAVVASAPRPLKTPPGAKPLSAAGEAATSLLQQASAAVPSGARIVQFKPAAGNESGNIVRQPGAIVRLPSPSVVDVDKPSAGPSGRAVGVSPLRPSAADAVREPVAENRSPEIASAPLRTPFIPLAAPAPSEPPPAAPLPDLPAQPNFDQPNVADGNAQSGPYVMVTEAPPRKQHYVPPSLNVPQPPAMPPSPPAAAFVPPAQQPPRSDPMQAVSQQALALADRGLAMAQRGMLFAGRDELIKALQLLAQALDVQTGTSAHTSALASGLTALEEARDFSPTDRQPAEVVAVPMVAQTHRTPLLKTTATGAELSPVLAQQQYFGLAQSQLVAAAGGQPVAAQVLYRLGRLQSALATHDPAPHALHGPQAMVFHQAALTIDANNYLAANELGVLLARYGQLQTAKELLTRSVQIQPQVESWHNLAVVHRRLGEAELARQADQERDRLAQKAGSRTGSAADLVRWVDTRTFAAAGGGSATPRNTAAHPASPKRR